MNLPILQRSLPVLNQRKPQDNIPQERLEREFLKLAVSHYVQALNPTPPMTQDELRYHSEELLRKHSMDLKYADYVAVLINNESWKDELAATPYERRLLLLPKCLRDESRCPAPFDEFGLLCKQCGLCTIQDLELEAERLGYAVLVAEGSAIVMQLIETGKIEAIVGVSCLNVLERAFPYVEAAAVPGISIPLLQDDCADCTVDTDWVWEVIHLSSEDKTYRMDIDALRSTVSTWFGRNALDEIMGPSASQNDDIARDWIAKNGKRWRPFLTVCAHQALQQESQTEFPLSLKKLAVAVECFHKASLIHDDIEDEDSERYGEPALHEEVGVPVALNTGDLLIGEGYRLISECGIDAERVVPMLRSASEGQIQLSQGQGTELLWSNAPSPMNNAAVIEIFRQKTAPAFEVALRLGLHHAGAQPDDFAVVKQYSEALGVAYQIRDDIQDWEETRSLSDLLKPNIILADAYERSKGELKDAVATVWRKEKSFADLDRDQQQAILETNKVEERVQRMMEAYKAESIDALKPLTNASLKGLLRRVIEKIFNDLEIKGWCSEFETRNASSRSPVSQIVG